MTVKQIIPSYLYQEYADDDDLQAFVDSYNQLAQSYLDWFNEIGLPIYTGLSGRLLDWVAEGLYGVSRPSLPYGLDNEIGPPNTFTPNQLAPNSAAIQNFTIYGAIGYFAIGFSPIESISYSGANNFVTSDDIFKRVITWLFYKGDGNVFNIEWLKRRCERFLNGPNGIDPGIQQTYEVSVVFGRGRHVIIIIRDGVKIETGAAVVNTFTCNSMTPNDVQVTYTGNKGRILKAGIETGVLALPFQFYYTVYG